MATPKITKPDAEVVAEPKTAVEAVLHNNRFEVVDNTDEPEEDEDKLGRVESEVELTSGLMQVNYV